MSVNVIVGRDALMLVCDDTMQRWETTGPLNINVRPGGRLAIMAQADIDRLKKALEATHGRPD